MQLRNYQLDVKKEIQESWNDGVQNVLAVLPTGAGKTVLFASILHDHTGASCAIAHRQELVCQISLALAREKIKHRIIGPKSVVRLAVSQHMDELGNTYYDPSAQCAVAGVDTLVRRGVELARWLDTVSLWVQDEAHHVLTSNKWGKAVSMFRNARGLGVTATPIRADGAGLGSHTDGVFHKMVVGPGMRDLINASFLTPYRIFAPPSNIDYDAIKTSVTGDFSPPSLKIEVRKSRIVGDVVAHYLKIAVGKRGVTFTTDVETATDVAAQFNAWGVPAAVVSAKTSDSDRITTLRKFKNGELMQLVNVDLFGEGFDLPAIEVVSMARPTQSFALYAQQFGRSLRLMEGKTSALIIDHVGNVERHNLPDAPRNWTLDRRDKRSKSQDDDNIPIRPCPECTAVYYRTMSSCPECGFIPVPAARSQPEQVDGDLIELDPEALAVMRGEIDRVDMDPEQYRAQLQNKGCPDIGVKGNVNRHIAVQTVQAGLRNSIALWAGYQRVREYTDSVSYRTFFFLFGIDVMSAQALKIADAEALKKRVDQEISKYSVELLNRR